MSPPVVTIVNTAVPPDREEALLGGFREMIQGPKPDGLLRTELLRGQDGEWRIQSTWRDRDALMAMRASGEPPAALALLDRIGLEHSLTVFTVEVTYAASG